MTRDSLLFAGVVLSFAAWFTAHVTIVFGLLRRRPRVRAFAALVLVPLAIYWALREKMRARAACACLALAVYAALRWMARG